MPHVYGVDDETPGMAYAEGYDHGYEDGWTQALIWAGLKVEA